MSVGVSLSAASGLDVTIPYTVSGTATGGGTDHDLADGSLTISAGATSGSVSLTISADALHEGDETVVVTMATGSLSNASAGATTAHTLTITDDDAAPSVTFDAATSTVAESAGTVTIGVTLSAVSGLDATTFYSVSGTATGSGTDHNLGAGSVTIAAGSTSGAVSMTVSDDSLDESDETVIVAMATGVLVNASAGAVTTHTVTITDNDTATVAFAASSQTVAESVGSVAITVSLSIESVFDVTVPYTVSGTASGGSVDHDLADGSLVISAGSMFGTLTISVADDSLDETDETVVVTITTGSLVNAGAGAVTTHTATITDNDLAPNVTFDAATSNVVESAGAVTVGVTLSAASGLDVTIPYTVSGTATGSGTDHDLADGSLTISAGATTGAVSLTISADALHEADETVAVSMTTGSLTNASAGATTAHTLTISDDDSAPSAAFDAASSTVAESAGTVTVAITLSAVSGLDATIPYTVSGTATGSGTDHDLADGSVTISAGTATGTVSFTVADDSLDETDETIIVSMSTGSLVNASAGGVTAHTVTVTDNDEVSVAFASASQSAVESAGTVAIVVSLSIASVFDVTIPYTLSGTASGGSVDHDFADGSLTVSAGATFGTITGVVTDDALDEDDETVVVTMSTGSLVNASAGGVTAHTVTVTDDDATPTVAFTTASQSVSEGVGSVSFSVTLSAVSGRDVTVPYTVGGTASGSGVDHDLAASSIAIAAGGASGSASFNVVADTTSESDETVVVSLDVGSLVNAAEGAQSAHTVTITDDDTAPVATAQSVSTAEETAVAITLAGTDADGDTLTYTISTQPTNGALSGTAPSVTYTPTADFVGADTFGFTVNDGQADSSEATVTVTVSEANDTPTLSAIAAQSVSEDGSSVTLTLSGIDAGGGSDENGQSITVTATSDAPSIVPHPTITGSPFTEGAAAPTLTFAPAADASGSATITVTAQDDGTTDGASDAQGTTTTFVVTVIAVSEASLTLSSGGESHVVSFGFSANAADGVDTGFADVVSSASGSIISAVFLRDSTSLARDILATPSGSALSWSLVVGELAGQGAAVTVSWTQADVDALLSAAGAYNNVFLVGPTGDTYSLSAANNGFTTTAAASSSETWTLTVAKSSVRSIQTVDISLTADTWHLISLPGVGDLTALTAANTSAFTWDAVNEVYAAVTDLTTVSSVASGLFLFANQTTTVSLELDVDAADARQTAVTLSPGWNLVGAPATRNDTDLWGPAPANLLSGGASNRVFSYDAAGAYAAATSLAEGSGYWALNPDSTDSAVTLTQARHLSGSVTQFYAVPSATFDASAADWSATLALRGPNVGGGSLTLGLSEMASVGYDAMDMPLPPAAVGSGGSALYVATDDMVGRLTRSVQPATADGAEWRVVVALEGEGTLEWSGARPPVGYRVVLSGSGSEWDLGERGSARLGAGRHELTARYVRDLPAVTALLPNYPNPFNPETWIPFELSEASDVRVEIYAMTGQLVRALALGRRDGGRHTDREHAAHWDGRNGMGEPVASGPYLYVLRAGSAVRYGRMVVLK